MGKIEKMAADLLSLDKELSHLNEEAYGWIRQIDNATYLSQLEKLESSVGDVEFESKEYFKYMSEAASLKAACDKLNEKVLSGLGEAEREIAKLADAAGKLAAELGAEIKTKLTLAGKACPHCEGHGTVLFMTKAEESAYEAAAESLRKYS